MLIYFLRHANAGKGLADPVKDEKRPIDEEGIAQCRDIGRALAALDVHLDLVISSPLKRASQTASLVGTEVGYEGKVQLDDVLRPGTDFPRFRELLRRHSGLDAIMVVGHNPNLSAFLGNIIGTAHQVAQIDLRKGAVARVEWDKRGTLDWCLTPRVVRTLLSARPRKS